MVRFAAFCASVSCLLAAARLAPAAESLWIEAEHLDGVRGYCWPMGRPEMKKTDGRWGLSGPGWAAEWNMGGEMKLCFGWAFVWDRQETILKKGPARLSLASTSKGPQPRQVDCIALTTDPAYRPRIKERPHSHTWDVLAGYRGGVPVEVSGDVEWLVNRTQGGWAVTLLNPAGQDKPQQGITPTDYRQDRPVTIRAHVPVTAARDRLLLSETLTVEQNAVRVEVPAGGVRIVEVR